MIKDRMIKYKVIKDKVLSGIIIKNKMFKDNLINSKMIKNKRLQDKVINGKIGRIYIIMFIIMFIIIGSFFIVRQYVLADVIQYVVKSFIMNDNETITQVKDTLDELTMEEKEVLETLFTLTQEIDVLEKEEKNLEIHINTTEIEVDQLEAFIEGKQEEYNENISVLERILIGYQRRGSMSYLDTLLGAGDLKTLIRSINIIREFTKSTDELLSEIEESKVLLEEEKVKLEESILILNLEKVKLENTINYKTELVTKQRDYLESLKEQKEFYTLQLGQIESLWEINKLLFSNLTDNFSKIINGGNLTLEDLNLTFSFQGIEGSIPQNTLNQMLKLDENLSQMEFIMEEDNVSIHATDLHIKLNGTFIIQDKTTLLYVVDEGSFYDMPLSKESIEELFGEKHFYINFSNIDGITISFYIDSVTIENEKLKFNIIPELF